jgi:unsaturated rhamnogalacturonyl hydrolase
MVDGENRKRIDLVVRAMLAMQRRTWEQGVAGQALLELGETDLVVLLARDAVVNQMEDGRLGLSGDTKPVVDPGSNGEPVLFAARVTGDSSFMDAAQRMADYLINRAPRSPDGTIYHKLGEPLVWVDGYYMVPPFLAVAGHCQEAVGQIEGFRRALWDPAARLFRHIWDEEHRTFMRPQHWGVGNGWAAAGMTRVVSKLPPSLEAERARIIGYIGETVDGCLAHLRPDGLFHDTLDDPTTFVETNTGQMLAYAIFRGVRGGWLPASYLAPAERLRQAAISKVDTRGLVQGVCGAPNFDRSGTATEGQAFHILMEAAHSDLFAPRAL